MSGDTQAPPDRSPPDGSGDDPAADFLAQMQRLHAERRDHFRDRFQRTLPFADQVVDRWEKARYLGFGDGASIYDSAIVLGDVQVGRQTWIGPGCILDGSGGLTIGSFCSVAAGCQIYSHDSVEWALSGGVRPYHRTPTAIGDACYLGPQAVIAAGVTIGKHCLVGALTFVKADLPDYAIAVGSPARVIGRVELTPAGEVRLVYATARPQGGAASGGAVRNGEAAPAGSA